MTMSDISFETLRLIRQMTKPPGDPSVTGEPLDPSKLDDLALGDLWAIAASVPCRDSDEWIETLASRTASEIRRLGHMREPTFRAAACRDCLFVLADEAEREKEDPYEFHAAGTWISACFALRRCRTPSFDGFDAAAMRLLAASRWRLAPVIAVAVARLVGQTTVSRVLATLTIDLAASPLVLEEARLASRLDFMDHLTLADVVQPDTRSNGDTPKSPHHRLSMLPLYAAFAETGLEQAAHHLRKIHAGETPYVSDEAFSLKDSAVIARLARVALNRDESWLPRVLHEVFCKVSVAPTSAKTVPSQSVAIALGHAVQAFPTPEAIGTLRAVLAMIRHAGVEKKLRRNLPLAERRLATRPHIALRVSQDRAMTKAEVAAITRALEAGLVLSTTRPYAEWREHLAEHAQMKSLTATLVWRLVDAQGCSSAVLPSIEHGRIILRDIAGAAIEPEFDCKVNLWHPSDASADERGAWRDRIVALRLKQPFKQVFREHYIVADDERMGSTSSMFARHTVAIRPFIGVARREGWVLRDDILSRVFGSWRADLLVAHELFPGATGATTTRMLDIRAVHSDTFRTVKLGEMPPAAISEILRTVDLLVSAAGIAMIDGEHWDQCVQRRIQLRELGQEPPGAGAAMRKEALRHLLRGRVGMSDLHFDARNLRLGPYAIHLATGRVTRDGESVLVEATTAAAAVPRLPYEDKLLDLIVAAAVALAEQSSG